LSAAPQYFLPQCTRWERLQRSGSAARSQRL
jgi:hypothetical protein